MAYISDTEMLDRFCCFEEYAQGPPKVVAVVAHPDDETLGLAGRLPSLPEITIVHVTDGSPRNLDDARAAGFATREAYASARRRELVAALSLAGIPAERTREIGLVDQEAAHYLVELTWILVSLFQDVQPDAVVTHPYEGGHPDHDATAFAVHSACRLLQQRSVRAPVIIEMTSYHNAGGEMRVCEFLPHASREARLLLLAEWQKTLKEQMIACFSSQKHIVRHFPVDREVFRLAPGYVFSQPPHKGTLFYEMFDWGMDGARWRALVGTAEEELGLVINA